MEILSFWLPSAEHKCCECIIEVKINEDCMATCEWELTYLDVYDEVINKNAKIIYEGEKPDNITDDDVWEFVYKEYVDFLETDGNKEQILEDLRQ